MARDIADRVKRVKVEDLKPSMIVANTVINDAGVILIAKNTMLNRGNFNKLVENNISYVYIIQGSINESEKGFLGDSAPVSAAPPPSSTHKARKMQEFKNFEIAIEETTEEFKNTLLDVRDGAELDIEHVNDLTENVMKTMKYKNDVLGYLLSLKDKDEYTYGHSTNVSLLANLFGKWLGYEDKKLMHLTVAGSMHDIGKTQIPDSILNKKGKLTAAEMDVMRSHTSMGFAILRGLNIPEEIKLTALCHHERITGMGYPKGLKHAEIPEFARIVSICDVFDAMTSNRVYRSKHCPFDVIKSFEHSSYGELDTAFLQIFLQNIAYTYVGSHVKLSDGQDAEVVFINPNFLSAPVVKTRNEILDLSTIRDIKVEEVL